MAKIINGRFVLKQEEPIASGGSAEVFRAIDLVNESVTAIKLFKTDFATRDLPFKRVAEWSR